jgi:hypothetical protein
MNEGFVYVATGDAYVAEGVASADSLRLAMTAARVALVTDVAPAAETARRFDHVVIRPDAQRRPIDKLLAWEAPFNRCVFLDTDTRVAGDLSGLFRVLDAFDLAALPEIARGWDYRLPGVPDAFAEFNTGVLAFRRTPAAAAFFAEWRARHERLTRSVGFVSDQPAFRWVAFEGPARVAPLPSEFNFISGQPNYTMWQILLLHGRDDPDALLPRLNAGLGSRVHVPGLGRIEGFRGRKQWFLQGLRLFFVGIVTLLRPRATPRSAANQGWLGDEARQRAQLAQPPSSPPAP